MSFTKYIERLKRMDQLIRLKATGDSKVFANKLGISRSMLMEYLREMRDLGAEIEYCRYSRRYYYANNCKLVMGFKYTGKSLSDDEQASVIGGGTNYFEKIYTSPVLLDSPTLHFLRSTV